MVKVRFLFTRKQVCDRRLSTNPRWHWSMRGTLPTKTGRPSSSHRSLERYAVPRHKKAPANQAGCTSLCRGTKKAPAEGWKSEKECYARQIDVGELPHTPLRGYRLRTAPHPLPATYFLKIFNFTNAISNLLTQSVTY